MPSSTRRAASRSPATAAPSMRACAPTSSGRRQPEQLEYANGPASVHGCGAFGRAFGFSAGIGGVAGGLDTGDGARSEEHTSELQSLIRNSYTVFCLNKKNHTTTQNN